jgi:RHS repeat-associated protein
MTEIHDVLYPPKEEDTRVSHRRYDAKERLIAWSTRQVDHFLVFRVNAFCEAALENGDNLDVPETIECRFSQTEVDPELAFADVVTYDAYGNVVDGSNLDSPARGDYAWTGREFDAEIALQYNRTRCYDPTPGRWITADPLGYDASPGNLYPYPDKANTPDSAPTDVPEDGN